MSRPLTLTVWANERLRCSGLFLIQPDAVGVIPKITYVAPFPPAGTPSTFYYHDYCGKWNTYWIQKRSSSSSSLSFRPHTAQAFTSLLTFLSRRLTGFDVVSENVSKADFGTEVALGRCSAIKASSITVFPKPICTPTTVSETRTTITPF